jgi:hypothetical protein
MTNHPDRSNAPTIILQCDEHLRHVHLRSVYGDSGENEGILSVTAARDATSNYPTSALITVGSPRESPLIDGYLPNLGFFSCGIEGAELLIAALQDAVRDVKAALANQQPQPKAAT